MFNVAVFVVFAVLWVAFAWALVAGQGGLDQAWSWIRELPLIFQLIVGVLFLPVVAGLWIWESTWPLVIRLVLVGGLAIFNLYLFFPRDAVGQA